jgi:hypothetical protein
MIHLNIKLDNCIKINIFTKQRLIIIDIDI